MMNNQQPESLLLLKRSDFKRIVDYIMSVPTGTLPGSRLAETLNILDTLTVVPAQAVPMLEQALRALAQPAPTPQPAPAPPSPDKKPNGAAVAAPSVPEP